MGALLQMFITLVWIIITGIVIVDITKDYLKVVAFILGATVGSYVGSIIEEYIAMGNNMLVCIVNPVFKQEILNTLANNKYKVINMSDNDKLSVLVKRKMKNEVNNLIKNIDSECTIITEKVLFN